ncbi:translation initiation factor IF-2 [Dysosmobacter sp.]|uniref:translation initiation factor IF-2 n=1 Tax=Dysosmobacter sp. TaxID=2591382 RepID=UPI002A99B859|nr:translation initiation factor IF-2 [Dysosmobacter sp.]MCI6054702.1 translation initiation factor IF-2 [Dysosmobacter sp.]MDY5510914.1 translation initiation factor IF-2 [Dysosmobacter sp.]
MGIEKYRVHEVAKDFGLTTKTITEILTKYAQAPKNHMQVLTDHELSLIFDYLTQHNQVSSIQAIFADTFKEKEKEAPKAPAAEKAAAPVQDSSAAKPAPKQAGAAPAQNGGKPQAAPQGGQQAAQQPQQPMSRVPQKKIVDTRKGGDVNLAKYDQRLEELAPERANRMQQRSGKEKIRTNSQRRGGMTFSNKRRQDEAEKMRRLQLEIAKKAPVKVMIPDEISVGELASRMKKTGAEVVKCLMKNGVMASLSQIIDFDTAAIIAEEMGCKVEKEITVTIEERLIDDHEDKPEDLVPRAPVVVVMGHVDHGKTSLLDTIRNTSVAAGEAGGITQHIGAYQVQVNGKPITFLDTPGHEAFTSMRARGAMITDIAILMVAADDGIMPQTIESINHAKAANIPIIVAINKIDKENANPDRVLQQLTEHGLVPEDWGGETICCKVSAKKNIGIDNLLEMVTLTAEMAELKANPNRAGQGTVIEARLDKGRGPVATLLVQNGTLKQGDIIIAGTAVGRVRTMLDYKGNRLTEAGPSVPVEIAGLSEAPEAGSPFFAVADERMARELVEQRKAEARAKAAAPVQKVSLENLFDQIQAGERKELALIVKADVQGSVEAVKASLEKLSNDEVNVKVIHGGVGAINESDVMLAASSNAIIVGFNVRPDAAARDGAIRQNVDMRMYRVIYDCIDEITAAMKGMLAPKYREVVLGHAEVRQTYRVSSVGTVAGCYVQDGKIVRACSVRVVRDGIVIHEGSLASLKRFKDDAKEVAENYECGLTVEKFNDIKEGDIIEAFTMEEIPR